MSDEILQIVCPSCGSKLNAKIDLLGRTRACPKCKAPVRIERPAPAPIGPAPETTPIIVSEPSITAIPTGPTLTDGRGQIENLPARLELRNRYLVLGPDRIVAIWETGKGWQVNVGNGFAPAKKNIPAIPDQGAFALVELVVDTPGAGPTDIHVFKISVRGALTSLYRDEGEILHKVDGNGDLTKHQKSLMLHYLRQHFMSETLSEAQVVLDYLNLL